MRSVFVLSILSLISTTAFSGGSGTVGPGNPAAIFCVSIKSQLQAVLTLSGNASALCILGDARVEQWTLFRELYSQSPQEALTIFAIHPAIQNLKSGNPASQYCVQVGGKVEIVADSTGNQMGLCEFSDLSQIEEWTLFKGPMSPGNQKLVNLINRKK